MLKLPEFLGFPAFVAQRIEHLTTDQKVGGSSPSKRTIDEFLLMRTGFLTNRIAFKFCFVSQAKAVQPAR